MLMPLRVLVVADTPDLTLLLQNVSGQADCDIAFHMIGSEQELRHAVQEATGGGRDRQWDLVVADYHSTGLSADAALRILQQSGLDLPLVVVTDAASEEASLRIVEAGARDCVRRDNLLRMGAVIRREQRQAQLRATGRMLAIVVECAQDAVISVDEDQRICYFNRGAENIFGYRPEEVLGEPLDVLLPEALRMNHDAHVRDFSSTPVTTRPMDQRPDIAGRRKDGTVFPAEASITKIHTAAGWRFTAILRDITERRRATAEMERLSSALEQTADSVMITDFAGVIQYVNQAFSRVTGYSPEEVLGNTPRVLKSGRHDQGFYSRMWSVLGGGEAYQDTFINRRKDGALYYEEKTVTPIRNESGEITHFISTGKDITERIQTQERLHQLAYHDPLTGLPNRALFLEHLRHALVRRRDPGVRVAVLVLDMDRFNTINDTLGYEIGDQLLREVPDRIRQCVRVGDTIARLGSDEFGILVEDITSADAVSNIARNILATVSQPFDAAGKEVFVTTSVGISQHPDDGADATALMKHADAAMYRAKEHGKNTFEFYAPEMSAHAVKRLTLETGLRHALERDEFVLYYQCQVSVTTGQIVGAEALIRWRHPQQGLVSPMDFIPILEDTGLIVPVGEWVLSTAAAQNRRWQQAGLPAVRVSVNLSPRQFMQGNLIMYVAEVLRVQSLEAKYLGVEITEGTIVRDIERTIRILSELEEMGVHLSVDDFGTGYSSLSYLKRLPLHTIKIDRAFVTDITTDPDSAAIARSIIAMSHSMKKSVIAEGAETEQQVGFLAKEKCDAIQGFYFSKPLPADEIGTLLQEKNRFDMAHLAPDTAPHSVLVLDDEVHVTSALSRTLRRDGYRVLAANTSREAFDLLATNRVAVVISDQRMPDMNGAEFLVRVKELYPDTIRIMLTAHAELSSIADAINRGGIFKFLTKPWDDSLLRANMQEAIHYYEFLQDSKLH